MTVATESICAELASLVGTSYASSDPQICAGYAIGSLTPAYAVFPRSAEQVAAVLEYASKNRLGVIPCRNATKLTLGNSPAKYDVALSLKEMNNVWHYEPSDLTISVEPGMKFGDFQHFAERNNLWLPLDPEGATRASIGGILATNSSGSLRHAFGSPRDMTLGMRIATTGGKIVKAGGRVVKNVAGYDISKLIIGSFGTLGVIVEASFKLFPRPPGLASFSIAIESLDAARVIRRRLLNTSLPLVRMVMLNRQAAIWKAIEPGTQPAGTPYELWIEAAGSERIMQRVRQEISAAGRHCNALPEERGAQDAEGFWEWAADFRRRTFELHPDGLIVKLSVPVSRQEELLAWLDKEAANQKTECAWMVQSGVGIMWVTFFGGQNRQTRKPILGRLRSGAREYGATLIFAQSSPGNLGNVADFWGDAGDDFGVMKKVKQAWDPNNILSPGRFVGGI